MCVTEPCHMFMGLGPVTYKNSFILDPLSFGDGWSLDGDFESKIPYQSWRRLCKDKTCALCSLAMCRLIICM